MTTCTLSATEQAIIAIAKEIMRESPGTTLNNALRHARDIAKHRGFYKIRAEDNQPTHAKTPWHKLPENVRRTIEKQRLAEEDRRRKGRELPRTKFVSGGKVSPK